MCDILACVTQQQCVTLIILVHPMDWGQNLKCSANSYIYGKIIEDNDNHDITLVICLCRSQKCKMKRGIIMAY